VDRIVVATITCNEQELPSTYELMTLEVHRELDKIPEAKLELLDGDVAKGKFEVSEGTYFAPGAKVEIKLSYGSAKPIPVFEGLVVRHTISVGGEGGSLLRVELKDATFKLTRGRKSAVFRNKTDKEAIAEVLGLKGDGEGVKYPELVQYDASDWDFAVSRADVAGLLVSAHLGEVTLLPMALGNTEHVLAYGKQISDFSLEIDATAQWGTLESVGWDLAKHEASPPEQATEPSVAFASTKSKTLAETIGADKSTLVHVAAMSRDELKGWASARLLRSRLSLVRGHAVVEGDAKYEPGHTAAFAGVGARFEGKALISAVTHKVDHEGWQTELGFGLSPEPFARTPDIAELPAGGLLPPIHNLQLAKVAPFEADPLGEHRIKIQLPALPREQGFVWARFMHPDAGKDRGFVFWPEAGDEVVVGFLGGDPRQAIVLGALHGKPTLPDQLAPSDKNDMRVIASRGGSFIRFDDAKNQIVLSTPGGATVTLDDEKKTIVLADQNGNGIELNDKGITITSGSDLNIEASGKVVIKGSAVDVQ
jgi:Rhs element Vgr protein